jgi:hypothetical protein
MARELVDQPSRQVQLDVLWSQIDAAFERELKRRCPRPPQRLRPERRW